MSSNTSSHYWSFIFRTFQKSQLFYSVQTIIHTSLFQTLVQQVANLNKTLDSGSNSITNGSAMFCRNFFPTYNRLPSLNQSCQTWPGDNNPCFYHNWNRLLPFTSCWDNSITNTSHLFCHLSSGSLWLIFLLLAFKYIVGFASP